MIKFLANTKIIILELISSIGFIFWWIQTNEIEPMVAGITSSSALIISLLLKLFKSKIEYTLDIISFEHIEGDPSRKKLNPSYKIENQTTIRLSLDNFGERDFIVKNVVFELIKNKEKRRYPEVSINLNGKIFTTNNNLNSCVFEKGKANQFWIIGYDNKSDEVLKIHSFQKIKLTFILPNEKQFIHKFKIENYYKNKGKN